MNMNEELKRQLEELKKELQEGQPLRLPFPTITICYDEEIGEPGHFLIGGEKRNGEWTIPPNVVSVLEFVLLKERCQYTYYNASVGKLTIKSSIVPRSQLKQAIDLISGKRVVELEQSLGLKPTFNLILLILAKLDGGFTPALLRLKGAALKGWIDFTKQNRDVIVTYLIRAKTRKEKRGSVRFFTIDFEGRELMAEEAKAVLSLAPSTVHAFEEWVFSYNNRHLQSVATNQEGDSVTDEDIEIEL